MELVIKKDEFSELTELQAQEIEGGELGKAILAWVGGNLAWEGIKMGGKAILNAPNKAPNQNPYFIENYRR